MNAAGRDRPLEALDCMARQVSSMTTEEKERLAGQQETALIELMKRQDPAGLSVLMKKYHEKLFSVANRICKNPADSEEVLQDVYMSALNKIERFEERSTLSTWLYRITVNAALMKLRSQRFSRNTVDMETLGSLHTEEDRPERFDHEARSPDETLMARELCDQIQDSVRALPDIYRDVFFLRDVHGFSIKETSEILETTPAAVKSRLHRSRFFLQDRLKPYLSKN